MLPPTRQNLRPWIEVQREAFLNNALNTHIYLQGFSSICFPVLYCFQYLKKHQSSHHGSRNTCVTISVKLCLHWGAAGKRLWHYPRKALLVIAVHSSAPNSQGGSSQCLSSAHRFQAHPRDQPGSSQAKLPLTA